MTAPRAALWPAPPFRSSRVDKRGFGANMLISISTRRDPGVATDAFVYDAIRTPRGRGKKTGSLHGTKPISLVVGLIDELRKRNPTLDADRVSDLLLGVVTPIGDQGSDIAKTAAIAAGLPDTVGGVQLNRFCASGLEAVNIAAQKVASGWDEVVIAGGEI